MKKVVFFAITSLILILTGCATIPTFNNNANLRVYLTDKPLRYIDNLWVKIGNVSYHYCFDGEEVWKDATVTCDLFDLLTLAGTEVEFFNIDVPEDATLTQIRMSVEAATVTTNGQEFPVTIPSSEIKIPMKSIVRDGDEMVLDFDVVQSLKVTGSGKYILRPVLIPFYRERKEYQNRYEIGGTLLASDATFVEKALVILLPEDESTFLRTTLTNKDGEFELGKWPEATYTISIYLDFEISAETEDNYENFDLTTISSPDYTTKIFLNKDIDLNVLINH